MAFDPGLIITVAGAVLSAGLAVGGASVLIRATVKRLDDHIESDEKLAREVIQRLATIETILRERRKERTHVA